jgi:hypothetical protein
LLVQRVSAPKLTRLGLAMLKLPYNWQKISFIAESFLV